GRDELRVRAEEDVLAHLGTILLTVSGEVGGDDAGGDVGARADAGVADVAEMVHLHIRAERRVLDLGEVADVRAAGEPRARAQVAHRPNTRSGLHDRFLDPRGQRQAVVADLAVADHALRADDAALADHRRAGDRGPWADDGVLADAHTGVNVGRRRIL